MTDVVKKTSIFGSYYYAFSYFFSKGFVPYK